MALHVGTVVDGLAFSVDAPDVGHVYGLFVVASHAVGHACLVLQLDDSSVGEDDVVVSGVLPPDAAELRLQVGHGLPLAACRAVHEDVLDLS